MLQIEQLEELVIQWAYDRGILKNGNVQTQGLKLVSEIGELCDNLAKNRDVTDDIGDAMVVLTIIANMTGTNLRDCYEYAYDEIKDRKGHLNQFGTFVKEGDE